MLPAVAARPAAGLREMMVEEGGADKEGGGGSPSGSGLLQQIGMLRLGACGRAAAATHRGRRIGGTRGHEVIVFGALVDCSGSIPGSPCHAPPCAPLMANLARMLL